MRGIVWVLAGIAIAIGTAAAAGPSDGAGPGPKRPDVSLPLEGVVTQPDWIQTPNGNDFATYYPPVAQLLNLSGRIVMRCEVSAVGALENCVMTQETPAGMGFGDAALKISQFFRMKPMSIDGAPVAGAKINIPIYFAAPTVQPEDAPPTDPATQPSPRALELARRIAATSFGPVQMQNFMDRSRKFVTERLFGASITEQEQAAIDDYIQAIGASGPQRVEALAQRFAREFTEQQLSEIAAFMESPAGQAWVSRSNSDAAEYAAENVRIERASMAQAREQFCGKYECLQTGAPPAAPPAAPPVKK
jgi:TonB family protein